MKNMKKALAALLAGTMVMSMGMTAFAGKVPVEEGEPTTGDSFQGKGSDEDNYYFTDQGTVVIKKNYNALNGATNSPAETFAFTVESKSCTDTASTVTSANMPDLESIVGPTYALGDAGKNDEMTKDITVTLPTYGSVGIYTYIIKETASTNAGVECYTGEIKLVVTVGQGKDGKIRVAAVHTEGEGQAKSDNFANTYKAGDLDISKTVTGNMGDQSKYFKVTVTLNGETGKNYAESYAVSGGSYENNPTTITVNDADGEGFWLKHGETITIDDLPYGVTYTVVEDDYTTDAAGKYDAPEYTFSDTAKKIDSEKDTVGIKNNKGVTVDTGIDLDSIPYIMILGAAALGMGAFVAKKRKDEDLF